jgi:murein DD-endopeptidase MepM/ murein hydrolase activator NlpD
VRVPNMPTTRAARPMRLHRAVTGALLVVTVLAVGAPTRAGAASSVKEIKDAIEQSKGDIDGIKDELDATRGEIKSVAEQVRDADAALVRLEAELHTLEAERAVAQATATAAATKAAGARAALEAVEAELESAEADLEDKTRRLQDRAVAAFMHGAVSYADVIVESRSVNDFVNTAFYLNAILDADQTTVHDIDTIRGLLVVARVDADLQRAALEVDQAAADAAAAALVALEAAKERATNSAAAERASRAEMYTELKVEEAATQQEIEELEAESVALEQALRKAQEEARRKAAAAGRKETARPGNGTWKWPADGRITSNYGYRTHPIYGTQRMHAGVDIGAPYGSQIVAANAGTVLSAYCTPGGYGCRIVIDHGGGLASLYAHQSSFAVGEGTTVSAGQTIGYIGSTGASTGPHLHFEVRRNGVAENPMQHY